MRRFRRIGMAALLLVVVGALAATVTRDSRSTASSCTIVLAAEVCTWVVTEGGKAVEMGATVPMALIEAVPLDAPMVWPPERLGLVELPEEARSLLGIDHMAINWEAHGHPPAAFLAQHFDFHFYSITAERVSSIDCADTSKPSRLPRGYALPDIAVPGMGELVGLCVPRMGMHAMISEETTQTEPFEASMLIGYYGGDPVFFEPMISREALLKRADLALEAPPIEHLPAGVRYPTAFRAEYDADRASYRLVFSGFTRG